jgi:malonate-semialdehyde dehydrogenase (acetylating) / methylmalonate-semialdehyde dehydrogenase
MFFERSFTVNVVPHVPLVTREHRDRVASYIDAGEQAGAKVLVDGRDEIKRDGFVLGCSLLDHVTPAMTVWTDEIFGPVLSVVRVDTVNLGFPQDR